MLRRIGDRYAVPGCWDKERRRRVPWAVAAFLLVRRRAWDEVGGFDDRQWMYAEDLDIGWRLARAGWATRYEPSAEVEHELGAATRKVWGHEVAPALTVHGHPSQGGYSKCLRGLIGAPAPV